MSEPHNFARPRGQIRTVTRTDLVGSVGLLGSCYSFRGPLPDADAELLHGRFETLNLRPGLILHAAAVRDLCDLNTWNGLHPGLKIVVVIGGCTDLSFGHHRFLLGPQAPAPALRSHGILVNLAENDVFSRRWQRHRQEQKVSLTITPEWLEQGGYECLSGHRRLENFVRTHLARHEWRLSARSRELARHILEPISFQPGLHRLQLESRCLELVGEALSALASPAAGECRPLRDGERIRLERLRELLHSEEVLGMTAGDIARRIGSNPTTLQNLAQRAWGCSLFERLRAIRMEKAHACISRGGSVAEAAEIAGYASANNFSTAFRRRYGMPPSKARQS